MFSADGNDSSGRSQEIKKHVHSIWVHRLGCILGSLISVYYMLLCVFSLSNALEEMQTFRGLGFAHSIWYYLQKNSFTEALQMFLIAIAEFLLYLILHYKSPNQKSFKRNTICFVVLLMVHVCMWLHAAFSDFPDYPPYIATNGISMRQYIFLCITMLESFVYCFSGCLCARN